MGFLFISCINISIYFFNEMNKLILFENKSVWMFIFGLFIFIFGMIYCMINLFDENYFVYEIFNFIIICWKV